MSSLPAKPCTKTSAALRSASWHASPTKVASFYALKSAFHIGTSSSQRISAPRHQDHQSTLTRQRLCAGQANSATRAGNEDNFVPKKRMHHSRSPISLELSDLLADRHVVSV